MENIENRLIEDLLKNEIIAEAKENSDELADLRFNLVRKTLKELLKADINNSDNLLNPNDRVLNIEIKSDCTSSADTSNLFKKGIAIMIALETLAMLAYKIEITLVISTNQNGKVHEEKIPVLKAGEKITMDTLTYIMLINSSYQSLTNPNRNKGCDNASLNPKFLSKNNLTLSWHKNLLTEKGDTAKEVVSILQTVGANQC